MIRCFFILVLLAATSAFAQEAGYQIHPSGGVVRLSDGAHIPESSSNKDWVDYQAWVSSGGAPRPAPSSNLRKPVWNGAAWEEGEPASDSDARAARNTARTRLRADVADPDLRGGLPALNDKVNDVLTILNHLKKLEDE